MKNSSLTPSLLFSIIILVLVTSCTKNPSSVKVIPQNAHVVTVYNISSIINKGDLYNVDHLENLNKLRNSKKNLKINEVQLIDKILDNPLSIGLNYDNDWFSFYINEPSKEQLYCFSAGVVNKTSITNFIQEFLTTSDNIHKIEEEENYNFTLTDNHTALAWDNKKLLIVSSENPRAREIDLKTKLKELFNLKPNEQLVNNDSFQEFYNKKKDISVWLSSNLYIEDEEFKQLEAEYDLDPSNNYFSFFFNFKKGQIDLDAKFDGNEKIEDFIANNRILNNNFNTNLLEFLPADNLSLISLSLNTELLFEKIKGNRIVSMASMSKVTPQELLESMGGSIALTVFDFKKTNESLSINDIRPLAALAFDLKNKDVLEELMSILPGGIFEKKSGYYEYDTGRKFNENIYLAFNNSICLVTNSQSLILNFKEHKTLSDNLSETSIASEIDDNALYFNLENNDNKFNLLKNSIAFSSSDSEKEMYRIFKQLVESLDFKLSAKNEAILSIKLINKKENSLKVIIETIDKNAALIQGN
jgi:hypothetical protein